MTALDTAPEASSAGRTGAYAGRCAVLATMHGKQAAIAPVLFDRLGLVVSTAPDLDTDQLGTFTGERPRAGTMRETAIAKAKLGMAATGLWRPAIGAGVAEAIEDVHACDYLPSSRLTSTAALAMMIASLPLSAGTSRPPLTAFTVTVP